MHLSSFKTPSKSSYDIVNKFPLKPLMQRMSIVNVYCFRNIIHPVNKDIIRIIRYFLAQYLRVHRK